MGFARVYLYLFCTIVKVSIVFVVVASFMSMGVNKESTQMYVKIVFTGNKEKNSICRRTFVID